MFPLLAVLHLANSSPPDPLAYLSHLTLRCPWAHFDCDPTTLSPVCVPLKVVRDCRRDCPNGADEWCGSGHVLCDTASKSHSCGQCVPIQEQNVMCSDRKWAHICSDPLAIHCASTVNCVLPQWIQDGKDDCGDGSDEDPCNRGLIACAPSEATLTTTTTSLENTTDSSLSTANNTVSKPWPSICEIGEFRCSSGECINGTKVLDERKDCDDGSDEDFCIKYWSDCRVETRPCSYQPDIAAFGCGCPRGHTRTEDGKCLSKEMAK